MKSYFDFKNQLWSAAAIIIILIVIKITVSSTHTVKASPFPLVVLKKSH